MASSEAASALGGGSDDALLRSLQSRGVCRRASDRAPSDFLAAPTLCRPSRGNSRLAARRSKFRRSVWRQQWPYSEHACTYEWRRWWTTWEKNKAEIARKGPTGTSSGKLRKFRPKSVPVTEMEGCPLSGPHTAGPAVGFDNRKRRLSLWERIRSFSSSSPNGVKKEWCHHHSCQGPPGCNSVERKEKKSRLSEIFSWQHHLQKRWQLPQRAC